MDRNLRRPEGTMPARGAWRRLFGYSFLLWFAFMIVVCVVLVVQPTKPDDRLYGFILTPFMGLLFGWPGWALVRSGRRARTDADRLERLRGMVHAHGWIPLASIASSLGLDEASAQGFVDRAIARWGVALTSFPDQRRYLHTPEVARLITIPAQHCLSCDAPSTAHQVLATDAIACPYCGVPLRLTA